MAGHPIQRFVEAHSLTQSAFGRLVGLSRQQVNNVVRGRAGLSTAAMKRIVSASGGELTLADLVNAQD
tara:strand:+ start:125 stop:328 length:204 start_codon:yes stop_codon:yes gene_type:complete